MQARFQTIEIVLVLYTRALQTSLSEGHISYYTTVREPGIFRNVVVSGYVTFYQINKNFVNAVISFNDKMSLWPGGRASRAVSGPQAVVWRPLLL